MISLLDNNIINYEDLLIDSLCDSNSYKSLCSNKKQNFLSRFRWGRKKESDKIERELEYIVMLSNLEATPGQKERMTQQLNLVKQQIYITKDKLIFYYSLDFTMGLLAWPLALISGILFVILSKDGLEDVFKSECTGAKVPATLFLVNTFWVILFTQVPLLLQLNQSYKYHLVTLIHGLETENSILSYIATNGGSVNNLINKNYDSQKLSKIGKNNIFIENIDQTLLRLFSRFDPGLNTDALPETSQYLQLFETTPKNTQSDPTNNEIPETGKFGTGGDGIAN